MEPTNKKGDKKGKLFGLINIVDLLVLLAVLAAVAGLAWKFAAPKITGSDTRVKMTFTVRVRAVHMRMVEEIEKNRALSPQCIAGNDNVPDAYVTDVRFEPYRQQNPTADGQLVDAEDPVRKDAIFTVEAMVPKNAAVLKVGPQEVRAGLGYYLKTKLIEYSAVVETVTLE